MTWLRVSDVRQFAFCPRVIWHRTMVGHTPTETPKMEQGRHAEAALARLEKRRKLRRFRLESAARRFSVYLESPTLRVSGICDLVLDVPPATEPWPHLGARPPDEICQVTRALPAATFPVEVKTTRGGVGAHHLLQLAGYALLLSESTGLPVDTGFILLLPADKVVPVQLTSEHREAFLSELVAIRSMLSTGRFPNPTRHRSFCPDCEHLNFCADVL